jgi:microtubule-associated protein, RP/EB family
MSKLNWTAKQEYEFMNNYKVLQESFKRNKITKPIPVERLMKCKMQDNLEWLQWSKVRECRA